MSSKSGRKGLRLNLWRFAVPLFVLAIILTSINYHDLLGLFGGGSGTSASGTSSRTSNTPDPNQALLQRATDSVAGKELTRVGYAATSRIISQPLVDWLDQQEQALGIKNPGPYVLFALNNKQANKPDDGVPPQVVMDAGNQVKAALYQIFTNGRGAMCYNKGQISDLGNAWVDVNKYLWGQSLNSPYQVTQQLVPKLGSALDPLQCYAFKP